jgi:hypothetical protein
MDYPNRRRLKLYARAETKDLKADSRVARRLALPDYRGKAERTILVHLEAYDWNCPQHITPRFTETDLPQALGPIRQRMNALEEENRLLRARIGGAVPGDTI